MQFPFEIERKNKYKIPNIKQITMTEIQNSKPAYDLE